MQSFSPYKPFQFVLIFIYFITPAAEPKIMLSPPNSISVTTRGSVTLECAVVGNPPPEVQWKTQGNSQSNFQLMVNGPGMLKLVIRNVTAEHQGNYTCHAQNIVGKTLETIQLVGEYVGCQYEYVSNSSTLLTN